MSAIEVTEIDPAVDYVTQQASSIVRTSVASGENDMVAASRGVRFVGQHYAIATPEEHARMFAVCLQVAKLFRGEELTQ